jgi:hypothetical protein
MILQVFDPFLKRVLNMFKSRVARLYLAQDFVGEFASHARCGFWSGHWSILGFLLEGSLGEFASCTCFFSGSDY